MSALLEGRVAVVTGAGRGIGRCHALVLARLGAMVVVNDVGAGLDGRVTGERTGDDVVNTILAGGGRAVADTTDVASVSGGRAIVDRAAAEFGRIDILINNAGFARGGGSVSVPVETEIDALLDVHLKAAIGTMSAAFPHMSARGWGRIVNTVSEVALDRRFSGGLGYSVAKAAVWSATLVAAEEGAQYGITVNAISPGARTRMNAELLDDGFRNGSSAALDLDPVHVARLVAFLVSDEASGITGRILHVAGTAVREYSTVRTARNDIVQQAAVWLAANAVGLDLVSNDLSVNALAALPSER